MSRRMRAGARLVVFCGALVSACAPGVLLAADPLPRSVLYLDENDPGLPFASTLAGAFRATVNAGHTERIAVFSENLDLVRSTGPRHEEILKSYLREKYRDTPIGVLTTVGPAALTFMLRARSELWPQMQRWGIGDNKVPPGSVLRFRQPTAWEQYQWQIIVVPAAFLLRSVILTGLLLEHRRRLQAEALARRTMVSWRT